MENHRIDPYPIPKDKDPIYINEPCLIDKSLLDDPVSEDPDPEEDNIRIYVPLDINRKAILRRLDRVIVHYGECTEDNETEFWQDVAMIISQIEIYDRIKYIRHMPEEGKHSEEGIELVMEVVARLKNIPDGCSEIFPFDTIEELTREYLS